MDKRKIKLINKKKKIDDTLYKQEIKKQKKKKREIKNKKNKTVGK